MFLIVAEIQSPDTTYGPAAPPSPHPSPQPASIFSKIVKLIFGPPRFFDDVIDGVQMSMRRGHVDNSFLSAAFI